MVAIREVLADGVFNAVQQSPDLADVKFERSLVRAISLRDTRVALVISLGDDIADDQIGRTTWVSELLVHAVTQDDEPDRTADEYLTIVHPIVMGYVHARLGGTRILKIDKPLLANVGGASCIRTATYQIQYQTAANSLE